MTWLSAPALQAHYTLYHGQQLKEIFELRTEPGFFQSCSVRTFDQRGCVVEYQVVPLSHLVLVRLDILWD